MLAAPLLLMLLSGCVTVVSECPEPTKIDPKIQARAADELDALPADSALGVVIAAALDDRDKLRACRAITK